MPPADHAAILFDTRHDHRHCLKDALDRAAALCRDRGVRLTPIRRRVLELVWSGHRPLGAYDILDALQAERRGAAPPTVYRALDFLREQGLVHRIESRNSFVGCPDPDTPHGGQFLICRTCAADRGPSSGSYWGKTRMASSRRARWITCVSSTPRCSARRFAVLRVTPVALSTGR